MQTTTHPHLYWRFLEAVESPMLLVDAGGIVRAASRHIEPLLGYEAKSLQGTRLNSLLIARGVSHPEPPANEVLETFVEGHAVHKTGRHITLLWHTSRIDTPEGAHCLYTLHVNHLGKPINRLMRGQETKDMSRLYALEGELTETQRRLRTIADGIPALISYIDASERVSFANRAYTDWFGITGIEVIGRKVMDLLGDADYTIALPYIRGALQGEVQSYERTIPFANGTVRHVSAVYNPDFADDGRVRGFYVLVRDITAEKNYEAELHNITRQQAAVAQLGHRALLGGDLAELMSETVQLISCTLGMEMAEIFEVLPGGSTLMMLAQAGWEKGYTNRWVMAIEAGSQLQRVLEISVPLAVHDLAGPLAFVPTRSLLEHGVVSSISVAIRTRDGLFGVMGAHTRHKRQFNEHDIHFVESLSNVLAAAVQRRHDEDSVFQAKERAQVTVDAIGDAVITVSADGVVDFINPAAAVLTGWDKHEALGQPLDNVLNLSPSAELRRDGTRHWLFSLPRETSLISRSGHEYLIDCAVNPIHNRTGEAVGAVLVFHDATEQRHQVQQLAYQASHDSLTSLVNRREFIGCLEALCTRFRPEEGSHILCYLDLDRFKLVNDMGGHAAGDELLRQISAAIRESLRETDLLARLGGDEFAILLKQCDTERALAIATGLVTLVNNFRFNWEGRTFTIGVSIGVAVLASAEMSAVDLMNCADTACYMAKEKGRGCVHLYTEADKSGMRVKADQDWAARIRSALTDNRLMVHYQPIVPMNDGSDRHLHFETLVRVQDENGHLLLPGTFMPAAERHGLASTIDRWVLIKVLDTLAEHPDTQMWVCTVNLSAQTLCEPDFLEFLTHNLHVRKVQPSMLCLEFSEITAFSHLSMVSGIVRELKALGCRCALDQFGCGMTMFTNLKAMPVDYLKIDSKLIREMVQEPINRAMVDAIRHIGQLLGIKIIANFTETDEMLSSLDGLGVDFVQGYAVSKPNPFSALPEGLSSLKQIMPESKTAANGQGVLSERQQQILHWLYRGKTNWEIAQILGLTPKNVKYHIEQILAKIGAKNRTQAVAIAMTMGLIQ